MTHCLILNELERGWGFAGLVNQAVVWLARQLGEAVAWLAGGGRTSIFWSCSTVWLATLMPLISRISSPMCRVPEEGGRDGGEGGQSDTILTQKKSFWVTYRHDLNATLGGHKRNSFQIDTCCTETVFNYCNVKTINYSRYLIDIYVYIQGVYEFICQNKEKQQYISPSVQ